MLCEIELNDEEILKVVLFIDGWRRVKKITCVNMWIVDTVFC